MGRMNEAIPHDPYPSRIAPEPGRIERADPVLYSAWSADAPIRAAAAHQYEQDGFLVLEGLFDAPEVEALQQELARLLEGDAPLDPRTLIREPDSDAIRSIFKVHEQSPLIGRLAADARLAGVARFLLGDEVYVHQSRLNYKPGFKGREFYWHSDFETWHVEDGMPRMRALSASILLSPNDAHNGPLMLIPGSQRHYLTCVGTTPADHYKASLRKQEYGVPAPESLAELVKEGGIASVTGAPGTVVFFDCNTMHGSNGNITPMPRSNAFFVYNAWCNRLVEPFGGIPPRPEYIATREVAAPLKVAQGRLLR